MFRFFRFCSGRSWCESDYVSYVLDTPFWVEFRKPVFDFSTFCFLSFTLTHLRKRLSRFSSDWFEFRKPVFLDIEYLVLINSSCRSDYVAYVWLIQSGSSFEVRFRILFRFCLCVSRWCECESDYFALGLIGSSWQSLILDFQSWR